MPHDCDFVRYRHPITHSNTVPQGRLNPTGTRLALGSIWSGFGSPRLRPTMGRAVRYQYNNMHPIVYAGRDGPVFPLSFQYGEDTPRHFLEMTYRQQPFRKWYSLACQVARPNPRGLVGTCDAERGGSA